MDWPDIGNQNQLGANRAIAGPYPAGFQGLLAKLSKIIWRNRNCDQFCLIINI
jgi:hypothetical protein